MFRGAFGFGAAPPASPAPFVVREYAHQHSPFPQADHTDFAETVFWHPVCPAQRSRQGVRPTLSDEVTAINY